MNGAAVQDCISLLLLLTVPDRISEEGQNIQGEERRIKTETKGGKHDISFFFFPQRRLRLLKPDQKKWRGKIQNWCHESKNL